MTIKQIDDNITISKYNNFYLICNSYNLTPYYYLGFPKNNEISFTIGLRLHTSPIAFKNIIDVENYAGIESIKGKNQTEKDLIFLYSQIESRTNGNAEQILNELLIPLGDIAEELKRMGKSTINDGNLSNITNETVINKLNELSNEITADKNRKLFLANAGKKGKIIQMTNNPNFKDGLYYENSYLNKQGEEITEYNLIGNILIHSLTLTYDKLKLFNPVATIQYTNTTTNQVVTLKKQPYEAIANNLINNRLIDSNNLGVENLLNKIWVQGVNNLDFITAETDLLKDGFFIDKETGKVLSNNVFENLETSATEVKKAVTLFNEIISNRREAIPNDCTLFRFMLWSPFAYCLKQLGFTDGLYSMVLWGVTDTNKTGSSVMFSYLYTDKATTLQKANTQSAIGTRLGENTFPLILDEAKDNLENPNDEEFNKNIVTDEMGRAVKDRTNNNLMVEFPALRLTVRTLNKNLTDQLKDEFYKRHKVLEYNTKMQVKEADKVEFNKKYKPNSPETPLHQLKHLGKAFAERFIPYLENKSDELYDLEALTIKILEQIEKEFQVSFNTNAKMIQKLTNQSRDTGSIIKTGLNNLFRKSHKLPYGRTGYMKQDFINAVGLGAISWLGYQPRNDLFLIKVSDFEKTISDITGQHMEIGQIMELLNISEYEYKDRIKFKNKASIPCVKIDEYNLTYKLFDINIYDDNLEELEELQAEEKEKKQKKEEAEKIKNTKPN